MVTTGEYLSLKGLRENNSTTMGENSKNARIISTEGHMKQATSRAEVPERKGYISGMLLGRKDLNDWMGGHSN